MLDTPFTSNNCSEFIDSPLSAFFCRTLLFRASNMLPSKSPLAQIATVVVR